MEHQPREHPVPCQHCRRSTWAYDAICDNCLAATVAGHDPGTETGRSDARHDPRVWDLLDLQTFPPVEVNV